MQIWFSRNRDYFEHIVDTTPLVDPLITEASYLGLVIHKGTRQALGILSFRQYEYEYPCMDEWA